MYNFFEFIEKKLVRFWNSLTYIWNFVFQKFRSALEIRSSSDCDQTKGSEMKWRPQVKGLFILLSHYFYPKTELKLAVCVCVSLSYSQGVIWDKKTHYCFLHQQRLWNEKETTSPSNPCVCLCSMLVSPQPPCGQLCSLTSDFF